MAVPEAALKLLLAIWGELWRIGMLAVLLGVVLMAALFVLLATDTSFDQAFNR